MDMLDNAAAWLGQTLATHAGDGSGRTIEIKHGANWITIAATVGNSDLEVIDEHGQLTTIRTRDYLVDSDELVFNDIQFEPDTSMQIRETLVKNSVTRKWLYQVIAPDREQCFRYSDHHRNRMRIHTERIQATQPIAS